MNVYVAGSRYAYNEVRTLQQLVRNAGHSITYDWTQDVARFIDLHRQPELDEEVALAHRDMRGVRECDLLVLLGHRLLCGAWIEVGMALAWDARVWLVDVEQHTVFLSMPNVRRVDRATLSNALRTLAS